MKLQSAFSATRWVWLAALLLALLAVAGFYPSPTSAQSASLTATVHGDKSVDLAISNHQGNWWFKINSWGTCTAVTGTAVNGIQGYNLGTHSVWAYSDSGCNTQIAATTFTISAASLTATVNSDRSVDLTLSNGPSPWYFRIGIGTCTAVTGTTISGIQGYAPGYHEVTAFATAGCAGTDFLTDAYFIIPTATLAATVNSDHSVDLTLSNGPNNWWFRINSWGTCTAATGTTVSNIQGYKAGTHSVDAYSDSGCHTKIASSSFTIPTATLAATVNSDRSVDLTLSNGPSPWYFRIGIGSCTAVTGTTVSGIQGYAPGYHEVTAFATAGCTDFLTDAYFIIPDPPPTPSLTATVHGDKSVDLAISNHQGNWWFKINSWGTCTAVTGNSINGIQGYKPGMHTVWAYSDSNCGAQIAATTFTISAASLTATVNTDRSVDLTLSNGPSNWWFRINWWGTCTAASGNTVSNIQGYQPGAHAVAAYSDGGCNYHVAATTFDLYSLSASSITPTTATLTLAGHVGDWWLKETAPSIGTCTAGESDYSHALSSLTGGTTYTYKAYSDSACATTALHTVSFTTTPVGVSNLSETSTQGSPSTSGGAWIANEFTTGSNTNGYTVSQVTVPISPGSGGSNVTLRIFSKGSGNANPQQQPGYADEHGARRTATTPSVAPATGCDLAAGTSYFLVLSATSGYSFTWAATASNDETGSVGWTIGNTYTASFDSGSSWTPDANTRVTKFSITATPK